MHIINAEFHDVFKISLGECLDEIGVYVLWSDNAFAKPSYLGEGNLVARIGTHLKDEGKPFHRSRTLDGVAAIMTEGTRQQRKCDAEILEHTLLRAADCLDIFPHHNRSPGRFASVLKRGYSHDKLRINVRGMHPLRVGTKLTSKATLTWSCDLDDDWTLDTPWRRSAR